MNEQLIAILKAFDITQLLKGKGNLRRWSAKFVVKFCLYCGIIKNQTKWITNLLKNNYR